MEARILHRDDRLRGEILQQRDLLVGKRLDLAVARSRRPRAAYSSLKRPTQHRIVPTWPNLPSRAEKTGAVRRPSAADV